MEMIKISKLEESRCANVTKQIPIITDDVLASVLFIHADKKLLALTPSNTDVIHYIIKGTGRITIDGETRTVAEGSLILVPKNKPHYYSTSDDELIVLNIKSMVQNGKISIKKGR
jgi:quercetin dioxygenase-like cupin family protein